ncbi:MAG: Mpo1-like protein [Alphaproteobacteria bacterium]
MAGGGEKRITTYREFWPFYLGEHAKALTRAFHFTGTLLASACLLLALLALNPWWLLGAAFAGYGPAWIGHFFVEKNRPATFSYPLWSLASDYRMTWAWLTGRLEGELKKAGVRT